MRYWVYFVGTSNGRWIEAANMRTAKILFARSENVPDDSPYIRASKRGPRHAH